MSIVINMKVNDGVVLAADSAATFLHGGDGDGQKTVVNVYNHANKIFNLVKGLRVGMITWGTGGIGKSSIETLAKDLRKKLTEEYCTDDEEEPFREHEIGQIAERVFEFMFGARYQDAYGELPDKDKPLLGFVVAGYSSQKTMAEEYVIQMREGELMGPEPLRNVEQTGVSWHGQTDAISRLLTGVAPEIQKVLHEDLGVPEDQLTPAYQVLRNRLTVPLVPAAMPIQDAIDLARFLVDVTINYHRFLPGAPVVGGPIEIAAITKHEGFKWVERKHYYTQELNPEDYP